MSATMDADKISAYFDDCPTLYVPGRTYPINVQYLEDAIEYTRWTISENSPYARRCMLLSSCCLSFHSFCNAAGSDKFYKGKNRPEWSEELTTLDDDEDDANSSQRPNLKLEKRYSPETTTTLNLLDERLIPYDLIIRLMEKICFEDSNYNSFSAAILIFVPGLGEIRRLNEMVAEHPQLGSSDFRLYPLHSTLSSESQSAVFDIPPAGVRKIVIGK
jgi:ATP-dependent RNA helicase DHX29